MTNYRLRIPKDEMGEWRNCFTCGLPLERRQDLDETGSEEEVWGCSARAFHLLIWADPSGMTSEPEFI